MARTMPPTKCWCASLAPKRLVRLGGAPYKKKKHTYYIDSFLASAYYMNANILFVFANLASFISSKYLGSKKSRDALVECLSFVVMPAAVEMVCVRACERAQLFLWMHLCNELKLGMV